jgi:nucleotide-binding universal stress UspA family protein
MNFNKILIAVDDSPIAEKVASKGCELGQQLNAEIAIISVADTTLLMTEGSITPNEMAKIIKSDLIKSQQILVDRVFKDTKVWTFVEEGKPYEIILKVANEWGADLLVIGTHGRTGISHLLLGSVSEHVVRHTSIPVLVIPSK